MYKITIEKQVKNPNYEKELEEYSKRNEYWYSNMNRIEKPNEFFLETSLITELEENEWKAVKKAIIECK